MVAVVAIAAIRQSHDPIGIEMQTNRTAYDALEARFREIGLLKSIVGTLNWDRYALLGTNSSDSRAEQLGVLEGVLKERLLDPAVFINLERASTEQLLNWQSANLREMKREVAHAKAIPASLNLEWVRATTACELVWREAKKTRNIALAVGELKRVIEKTQMIAQCKAKELGKSPYEALLDQFEPGMELGTLRKTIAGFKTWLPRLANAAQARPQMTPMPRVEVERQRNVVPTVLTDIGFDLSRGVIAESAQPCFSDDTPDDVRITLKYERDRPMSALLGGLHESGHSFYERQVPQIWRYQPIGRPRSGGLQESQALIWECHVGSTKGFRQWIAPKLQASFGWTLNADDLLQCWSGTALQNDRLDSGELGYLLHLLLRCELEIDLIEGNLSVDDLPAAWDEASERWLCVPRSPHSHGMLADIHWYRGLFGYFPSYLIGAMAAAQLMSSARQELPEMEEDFCNGKFKTFLGWLEKNVHKQASSMTADDIIKGSTGRSLDDTDLRIHLQNRHLKEPAE